MKILCTLAFFIFSFNSFAQAGFDLPQNIELKTKEDYARYEDDIIKAAEWLAETDLDKEVKMRQLAGKFVMEWMAGTPTVTIELNEPLVKVFDENPSFMAIFFANGAAWVLRNPGTSKAATVKAGLLPLVKVYQKNIAVKETAAMKELVEAFEKNSLDELVAEKFIK